MRQHFDNANGVLAVLFIVFTFIRVHLSEFATAAALIYSLMLIGEKAVSWRRARRLRKLATDGTNAAGA